MPNFLEAIEDRILVGDGAMGTLLLSRGIRPQQSFETLSLTDPAAVRAVHEEYIAAGADLIETNTFGANRIRLAAAGYQNQAGRINREAARIARRAAGEEILVAGSVGMIHPPASESGDLDHNLLLSAYLEQITALAEGGVDCLLLETFEEWENLSVAIEAARQAADLPIIAQMTLSNRGLSIFGEKARDYCARALAAGADVFGSNCGGGFAAVSAILEGAYRVEGAILSAYPNAGIPEMVQGRMLYPATPQYFSLRCLEMLESRVRLIGGCCGTTPRHIQALRRALDERGITGDGSPRRKKIGSPIITDGRDPGEGGFLTSLDRTRLPVIVEIDPPASPDLDKVIEGALAVKKAGAAAISLADNPLARQRVSSICAAGLVRQRAGIQVIPHLTGRDHNILGIQSLLMGAHLSDIQAVLAVTGDPIGKAESEGGRGCSSLDSVRLIRLIDQLNRGHILSGKTITTATDFSIGCAFNPNAANLKAEVLKLRKKADSGARFAMTQPVFSSDLARRTLEAAAGIDLKIFVGILPLLSSRNAEFIHNEVPGITISRSVRKRLAACSEKQAARKAGLEIARELIFDLESDIEGLYLISPLNRWRMPLQLLRELKEKERGD